jgi:hypothetical protein
MRQQRHIKMALVIAFLGIIALPVWASGFTSERSTRPQMNLQISAERFDKILHMARIQHAQIEDWHKRTRLRSHQNSHKARSIVALQK